MHHMAAAGAGIRVVIVDDSRTMRATLRGVLEGLGHTVVAEGETGLDVTPLYELHRPAVMLIDIIMPGRDGLKSVRSLIERHPEARVVVCSSLTRREKVLACKNAGAAHYLVKPFDAESVQASIKKALASGAHRG